MNEFVNFKKRGVELPPGCKDLIDVLSLSGKATGAPSGTPRSVEGLKDVEKYVSRLMHSPAHRRSVWIESLGIPLMVGLSHNKGTLKALIFFVVARDAAIRSVLRDHGVKAVQDNAVSSNEYFTHFILCPLASEAIRATQFVSDLLRKGFGFPDRIRLEFRYREHAKK